MNQAPFASWIDRLAAHPLLISFLLFAVALSLRLLALDLYVTPDELVWVYRSILFREAVRTAEWANTLVAGHPGVTTTWLGTAALSFQLAMQPAAQEVYTWITQLAYLTPDNMAAYRHLAFFLDTGRTAVALVNSLGVVAVFWLVRELLTGRIALVAVLILALDPFVSGLSGLFHVDGLLMTGTIISLLALALGIGLGLKEQDGRRRMLWLILSGAAGALSVLSKSPGLLLLPVAALGILSLLWREEDPSFGRRFGKMFGYGALWLGSFLFVLLLLYPALWAAPLQVFSTAGGNAGRHVAEALRPTFFMGDVAFDHGAIFYPVAMIWRLSPLVIGGLVLLLVFLFNKPEFRGRKMPLILLLALWALLFLVAITFAAKKFDRYLLPLIPALAILAAVALADRRVEGSRLLKIMIVLLVIAHVFMLAVSLPYLLSAYNPLAGGPYTAQYVMPLGWGESVSASGSWLADTPSAEEETAVSGIAPSLAPFFPGETLFAETSAWQEADHLILTANTRQVDPQALVLAEEELQLSHTIHYGLLPQAWIYNNPDPQSNSIEPEQLSNPVSFAGQMRLLSQDIRADQNGEELLFTTLWQKEQSGPLLIVKIQLLDEAGNIWQESETDLLNEHYFYPQDWTPDETPQVTYRLDLPLAMPPGAYSLKLSLVDQKSGGQLPVYADQQGGVVYDAGTIYLDLPLKEYDPGQLPLTPTADSAWLDGKLTLLGIGESSTNVQAGGDIHLELFWQTDGYLPPGLQIGLQLDGQEPANLPLSSLDTAEWDQETVLRQKYTYPVPGDMSAGDYQLTVSVLDIDGRTLSDPPVPVSEVHVQATDRTYILPGDIELPLQIRFEPGIVLRGVSPGGINTAPGETVALTLYWQTEVQTTEPVTAFLHLLDQDGEIVVQSDQWPGGLPSDVWSPNQVIIDEHELLLPAGVAGGDYQIVAGLYTASDGVRLPAFDHSGESIPGDQYLLPIVVSISE